MVLLNYDILILVLVNIVTSSSVCPSEEVLRQRMEADEAVRESVLNIFWVTLNNSSSNLTNTEVYESVAAALNVTVTPDGYVSFEEAISEIASAAYSACLAPENFTIQEDDIPQLIDDLFRFTNAGRISEARVVYGELLCLQDLLAESRKKRQTASEQIDDFFDMLPEYPNITAPIFGLTEDQIFGILPTLAFVVDDTGSMADEISSVQRLIFSFIQVERSTPIAYILNTFNDPGI